MARSYKGPWVCDRNPRAKNYANRKLRRIHWWVEIADGRSYRKYTNPWDICDWRWFVLPIELEWEREDQQDHIHSWWARWRRLRPEYRRRELRRRKLLTGNARAHRKRVKDSWQSQEKMRGNRREQCEDG